MAKHDDGNLTVRQQIVNALVDGFGPDCIADVDVSDDETLVHVTGFDHPITVTHDDIILPYDGSLDDAGPGIRLDVQAILADNATRLNPTDADTGSEAGV